jgi:hypothetical protein
MEYTVFSLDLTQSNRAVNKENFGVSVVNNNNQLIDMKIIVHKTIGYKFWTFIERDELLEYLGPNEELKLCFVIDMFERKPNNWIVFDLEERKQRFCIQSPELGVLCAQNNTFDSF